MATQDQPGPPPPPPPPPTTTCKVILGSSIAKDLLAEVKQGLATFDKKPLLVGFLANEDPAARMYADWTGKTARENGFDFSLRLTPRDALEEAILSANACASVAGIIVYYPIFPAPSTHDAYIRQLVSVAKDVEGLCHAHLFSTYQNIRFLDPPRNTQKCILPCTPLAVLKVLEHLRVPSPLLGAGDRLFGRTVAVVNRSEVVGRPLAALLANDGARVFSVDAAGVQLFTRGAGIRSPRHAVVECPGMTLAAALAASDVVVSGVPGDAFKIPAHHLRDGAVCVNFSSERNFVADEVKAKASIYVPAIGKVTIAVLLRNLLRLAENQRLAQHKEE